MTAGRHSFAWLRARMGPEALPLGDEMDVAEARRALKLLRGEITQTLHIGQDSVAKSGAGKDVARTEG
jgi:hypothetical protein